MATPATAATPKYDGKVATIVGIGKSGTLVGTSKADVINAGRGNDTIHSKAGSPSNPDVLVSMLMGSTGDDYCIDVEVGL